MQLSEYKQQLSFPLRQTTLLFLYRDNEILLAMKKRGFGQGKWNGVGGKRNADESIEEAAIRETEEEIGVKVQSLEHVATLGFYFPHVPLDKDWNQQVIVYFARAWEGEPTESEEMAPQWYKTNQIPFELMWPDDAYWLPLVIEGKFVSAEFAFGDAQEILNFNLTESIKEN